MRHEPALDGLRGCAILLVLTIHASLFLQIDGGPLAAGWLGVDLFFVLSGYLITGILLDARGQPGYFRVFYARRALRIFPAYYLVLVVGAALGLLAGREGWFALFLLNVNMARDGWTGSAFQPAWSLAVEEQFYLVWPLLLAATPRRAMWGLLGTLLVGGPLVRLALTLGGAHPLAAYVLMPARMDSLAAGALVAMVARSRGGLRLRVVWARRIAIVAGGLLLSILVTAGPGFLSPAVQLLGYSLAALTAAACLLVAASGGLGVLAHPLLRWFGRYSYALYLWHYAALTVACAMLPARLGVPLGLASALGIAWLSWRYLEAPVLRLKRFVTYPLPASDRSQGRPTIELLGPSI